MTNKERIDATNARIDDLIQQVKTRAASGDVKIYKNGFDGWSYAEYEAATQTLTYKVKLGSGGNITDFPTDNYRVMITTSFDFQGTNVLFSKDFEKTYLTELSPIGTDTWLGVQFYDYYAYAGEMVSLDVLDVNTQEYHFTMKFKLYQLNERYPLPAEDFNVDNIIDPFLMVVQRTENIPSTSTFTYQTMLYNSDFDVTGDGIARFSLSAVRSSLSALTIDDIVSIQMGLTITSPLPTSSSDNVRVPSFMEVSNLSIVSGVEATGTGILVLSAATEPNLLTQVTRVRTSSPYRVLVDGEWIHVQLPLAPIGADIAYNNMIVVIETNKEFQ